MFASESFLPVSCAHKYGEFVSKVELFDDGCIRCERVYEKCRGKEYVSEERCFKLITDAWVLHNDSGPAISLWYGNGNKRLEAWYKDGVKHNATGPSSIKWYENGKKYVEKWRQNGLKHRLNEPAEIVWDDDGSKFSERWFSKGQLYREEEYGRCG